MKLGINGLGRIGKLSLWHHVSRQFFSEVVVNLGRQVGGGLPDVAAAIEKDSTYGRLAMYLHGHKGGRVIEELREDTGTMVVNGMPVTIASHGTPHAYKTAAPSNIAATSRNMRPGFRSATHPTRKTTGRYPTRKPPVGPAIRPIPPVPPAKTGSPQIPASR